LVSQSQFLIVAIASTNEENTVQKRTFTTETGVVWTFNKRRAIRNHQLDDFSKFTEFYKLELTHSAGYQ